MTYMTIIIFINVNFCTTKVVAFIKFILFHATLSGVELFQYYQIN